MPKIRPPAVMPSGTKWLSYHYITVAVRRLRVFVTVAADHFTAMQRSSKVNLVIWGDPGCASEGTRRKPSSLYPVLMLIRQCRPPQPIGYYICVYWGHQVLA